MVLSLIKFKFFSIFFSFFNKKQLNSTNYYLNLHSDPEKYVKDQRDIDSIAFKKIIALSFYNGYLIQFFSFFTSSLTNLIFYLFRKFYFKRIFRNFLVSFMSRFSFKKPSKSVYKNFFFLPGIFDFLKKFKITLISLVLAISLLFLLLYSHMLSFQKTLAFWLLGFANVYWLFSTFVFFKKKYHWSRFTSSNQRFWKRTLLIFWVLELFLFLIFVYLSFNANTESRFMLDQLQIYKEFLYPVRSFLLNIFLYFYIVLCLYIITLTLKWQNINKIESLFLIISYILGFIFFNECYQFFHVINHYSNVDWEYDTDMEVWTIEFESRKERTYHHYALLLLILKFWHIIFIISVWFFFFIRGLEIKRFYYPSLAGNLNNFIFLYIFSWLPMLNWVKFLLAYIATYTMSEFFLQIRSTLIFFFFYDITMFDFGGFFNLNSPLFKHSLFVYQSELFFLND